MSLVAWRLTVPGRIEKLAQALAPVVGAPSWLVKAGTAQLVTVSREVGSIGAPDCR